MGATNIAGQKVFGKYGSEYKGDVLKYVFEHVLNAGILGRDGIPFVSGSDVRVPPFKVAILDKAGDPGLINISTTLNYDVTSDPGDEYIIARFEWKPQVNEWMDILSVTSGELVATDIILASISTGPLSVDSVPDIDRYSGVVEAVGNMGPMVFPVSYVTNTPPAHAAGLRIMVGSAGTGAFLNHNYELAVSDGSSTWTFYSFDHATFFLDLDADQPTPAPKMKAVQTATGIFNAGSTMVHNDTLSIEVDSDSATYGHISGTVYKNLTTYLGLKVPCISPVEYISNTPPAAAQDNKLYLCSDSPTGDWNGHAYQVAKDAVGGWEFFDFTDDTLVLSKENTATKTNWRFYIFKSNPSGYTQKVSELVTMDEVQQGSAYKKITAAEYAAIIAAIGDNPATVEAVEDASNTPPVSAADNKRYLTLDNPTGDWNGHPCEIAIDGAGGWQFQQYTVPVLVLSKMDSTKQENYRYWVFKSSTGYFAKNLESFLKMPMILPVYDASNTPPTPAGDDKRYLILDSPTGAWASYPQQIATDTASGWVFEALDDVPVLVLSMMGSASVDDWDLYIVQTTPSFLKRWELTAIQRTQFATLVGGSSADALHSHAQYDVLVNQLDYVKSESPSGSLVDDTLLMVPSIGHLGVVTSDTLLGRMKYIDEPLKSTMDICNGQYYPILGSAVSFAGTDIRFLDHPEYIMVLNKANGHLYLYDKDMSLVDDIDTGDTNISDKYGWYQNYVILFKFDTNTLYAHIIDIDSGTLSSTESFVIEALSNVELSDAIFVANNMYLLMGGLTGTDYKMRALAVDMGTLSLSQSIVKTVTWWNGVATSGSVDGLKVMSQEGNLIFSWVSLNAEAIGVDHWMVYLYDFSFKTTVALASVDSLEYLIDSYDLTGGDVTGNSLNVMNRLVGDSLVRFISANYSTDTTPANLYRVVGLRLALRDLSVAKVAIIHSGTSPSTEFATWYLGLENKSRQLHFDVASAHVFDFMVFSDRGELNSTITAIKANIIGGTVADGRIFILVNDGVTGNVQLWITNPDGTIMSIQIISGTDLTDVANGYMKVVKTTELGLQILFLDKENNNIYPLKLKKIEDNI